MPQVKIAKEYFKKSLNDYSDWKYAFVREFVQNAVDCGSKTIKVTCDDHKEGDVSGVLVTFENDGEVMDKDTIENKLLAVGGSNKDGKNSVGGFGLAKVILYFAHEWYEVQSGDFVVQGQNDEYNIIPAGKRFDGTKNVVFVEGIESWSVSTNLRKISKYLDWDGKILCSTNSSVFEEIDQFGKNVSFMSKTGVGELKKISYDGSERRSSMTVRVGGIPMFEKYINYKGSLVLDCDMGSLECLTSNRDGMKWSYSHKIDQIISEIAVNRKSLDYVPEKEEIVGGKSNFINFMGKKEDENLSEFESILKKLKEKNKESKKKHEKSIESKKEKIKKEVEKRKEEEKKNDLTNYVTGKSDTMSFVSSDAPDNGEDNSAEDNGSSSGSSSESINESKKNFNVIDDSEMFLIINKVGSKTPKFLKRDSMTPYFSKAMEIWKFVIIKIFEIEGSAGSVAFGWVLREDAEAAFCNRNNTEFYLLNPFLIRNAIDTSKNLELWKNFVHLDDEKIVSLAVHEYCHRYFMNHDDDYATSVTDLFTMVMKEMPKIKEELKKLK